jgi:hypothetical protein
MDTTTTVSQGEMQSEAAPQSSEMDATTTPDTGVTPETEQQSTTGTEQQQPESQPSAEDLTKELEKARAALKKANKEAASYRNAEKELKALKDQIEAEKLSEKERLEKRLADLQKAHDDAIRQAQEYKINTEVKLQAAQSGFSDPNDAIKFLDWSEIEYDDNGAPSNVAELVADLLKAKPYLAKPQSRTAPAVSATNPSRSARVSDDTSEYINRIKAGTLKADEYNALPPAVKAKLNDAMLNLRKK